MTATTEHEPTPFSVPLERSRYDEPDTWRAPRSFRLHVPGACNSTWSVGYVGPEGTARRVNGGPVLPGPYAYAFGLATVISAHPLPEDLNHMEVTAAPGDVLSIGGLLFRVELDSYRDVKLVQVNA